MNESDWELTERITARIKKHGQVDAWTVSSSCDSVVKVGSSLLAIYYDSTVSSHFREKNTTTKSYLAICALNFLLVHSREEFQIFVKIQWTYSYTSPQKRNSWVKKKLVLRLGVNTSANGKSLDRNHGTSCSNNEKCCHRTSGSRMVQELKSTLTIL